MNVPSNKLSTDEGLDKCERRAWAIFLVIFALFMLGLVMVCFWGGPFESDSFWLQEKPPTYPE